MNNHKGFTFIEIIVVIFIISILMSLVFSTKDKKSMYVREKISYTLQSGSVVKCGSFFAYSNLSDCEDGKEYYNQTNITKNKRE